MDFGFDAGFFGFCLIIVVVGGGGTVVGGEDLLLGGASTMTIAIIAVGVCGGH